MYTSGRTVKSKTRKPSAIVSATVDVRKLVNKHLAHVKGISVVTTLTADPRTLDPRTRTTVTFPSDVDPGMAFCDDLSALPGLTALSTDGYLTYVITRKA